MERDNYYDFLRGIAIAMVVGIHTYVDDSMHISLTLRQFLNCAVPLFLAISGFFIGKKDFTQNGSYANFLRRQLPRVYVPMLIWSMPWVLQAVIQGDGIFRTLALSMVGGMSIFYFIALIIQFYILTPAIQKINIKHGGGYSVIITTIGICLFDYILRIRGVELGLLRSGGPFCVWMAFYVMGVLKAQGLKLPFETAHPLRLAMAAIALSCLQIYIFYLWNGSVVHGIKLSAHIYSYFIVMWLLSDNARCMYNRVKDSRLTKMIVNIGRISFFIYLTHVLIIILVGKLAGTMPWVIRWTVCMALSILFAICCQKTCPDRLRKHVGF